MKQIILFLLLVTFFPVVFAQPTSLKGLALQYAGYSVYAIDADNAEVLFETPQVSLVPASVMKVVTTAAALEILGPGFQFHTQIGYVGKISSSDSILNGNLVIAGGCDPAFYSEYFPDHYNGTYQEWALALSQAGIHSIHGDLIVDLSRLDGASIPGGWLWEDIANYYGAGVSALTYADNCYKIHFSSQNMPGKPVLIAGISPVMDSLHLINNVVSAETNRDLTVVYGAPGSYNQWIEGTIPKGHADFVIKAATPNPACTAAVELVRILESNGIKLSGKIRLVNKKTEDFVLIADKASPSLQELIIPLNRESINLFAEHLLREIGRAQKGSSALPESLEALKDFWVDKGIFTNGFYPTDGSGLSRSNGVCSRTLAEVIRYMHRSVNRDVFFNSLPVAGQSGTLQNAFKGSHLENNLLAKTGSMTRVRSLTGIFTNQRGIKVVFAVITNNFDGTQSVIGHAFEGLLNELYVLNSPSASR